jgi:hypothetical protein
MSENLSIEDLENLIDSTEAIVPDEAEARPPRTATDFNKIKKQSQNEAKRHLKQLVNFYLTPEMINNKWTIQKIKSDYENLTNSIFQLKVSDYLIVKALEEIDAGVINDRMLRALKDLQNQNMEVMKYNKQYLQIIDEEYEVFSKNYSEIVSKLQTVGVDELTEGTTESSGNIHRGSKSLIENLEEHEEAEFEVLDNEIEESKIENDEEE